MGQQQDAASSIVRAPVGLVAGAFYPFQALIFLLQTPKLWSYVLVPFLVNLVIGTGLYLGLLWPGLNGIDALVARLSIRFDAWVASWPKWLSFIGFFDNALGWLLRGFLVVGLLLIIGFILVQFGVIFGAPWYGQLSEQLERLKIGRLPEADTSLAGIFREIGRSLGYELRKLQLVVMIGIPLVLLNFIPAIGTVVATLGSVAVGATLVGLDFLSAPLDRRKLNFQEKLAVFRQNLPASATFGLVCLGLVSIPLLNLLSIPLCMAAGTLFFCDRVWPVQFAEEAGDPGVEG